MKALYALAAIGLLIVVAVAGAAAGLGTLFGVVIPYVAAVLFLGGFVWKIVGWARSPVPFRIPTTSGQQKSLPWIKSNRLDNPHTGLGAAGRVLLEVFFFRSLFRNTKSRVTPAGQVVHDSDKWLWAAGLAFHASLAIVLFRHLRLFLQPVPGAVNFVDQWDGFFQLTTPAILVTDALLIAGLGFLLVRRFWSGSLRYLSLASDYFALFLLLGIAISGVLMRHVMKADVVGAKELALGLVTFSPNVPANLDAVFYVHLLLVCVLFAYFPFSKLMHMGGVFLSPTRNLANNNRARRHVGAWNPQVHPHTYAEWEEEFRDKLKAAGYTLEGSQQ